MNFKIENRIVNITNYPSIARHFEDMARRGWLIHRVVLQGIFIYKKIEAENLDFAITPYEVETEFTRKTKAELEEFQTVCESVGWNYATKSRDFHIYFKDKDTQAIDIETDQEEEFNTIERIAKKQLRGNYITIPLMIYFIWTIFNDLFKDVISMKSGIYQLVGPSLLIFLIALINDSVKIRIFLKTNRKNIEEGKNIKFKDSKLYFERILFLINTLFLILLLVYFLYSGLVLKNKIILFAIVPSFIGITIGLFYRAFVKPSKKSLRYKKTTIIILLIVSVFISISVSIYGISNLSFDSNNPDIEGYKVLLPSDFNDIKQEEERELWEDFSILIPKSYDFSSRADKNYIITDYSKALTEGLAKSLVDRYVKQEQEWAIQLAANELDNAFEEDEYSSYLKYYGLSEKNFNNLKSLDKKEARKKAEKLIRQRYVKKDTENLWNMDEVYFLNPDKDQIVIRNVKEVFYLGGLDFSDPEIIKIVKEKLNLS